MDASYNLGIPIVDERLIRSHSGKEGNMLVCRQTIGLKTLYLFSSSFCYTMVTVDGKVNLRQNFGLDDRFG